MNETVTIELTRAELAPIMAAMTTMNTLLVQADPCILGLMQVLGFDKDYDRAADKLNDAYKRLG